MTLVAVWRRLRAEPRWILEGDLGPCAVPAVRLSVVDTVVVLDFSL